MNVDIRIAGIADAPTITTMIARVYEENGDALSDEFRKSLVEQVFQVLEAPDKKIILAIAAGKKGKTKIAGMIAVAFGIHPVDGLIANGDYLYVLPQYRNSGIAEKLLVAGEGIAVAAGATKAYTESKPQVIEALHSLGWKVESMIMSKVLKKEVK